MVKSINISDELHKKLIIEKMKKNYKNMDVLIRELWKNNNNIRNQNPPTLVVGSVKKIRTIPDGNTDFSLVELIDGIPHCKIHGAMLSVSEHNNVWRCVQAKGLKDCRAGCILER